MYTVYLVHGPHRQKVGTYATLKDAKRAVQKYGSGADSFADQWGRIWSYIIREEK